MPEIIVYTNDGDCANGVAEIQPFTTGDATDEWTLRFNNGTDFYEVDNVTMRVGHVNGLPTGTYNDAFRWNDRAGNVSIGNIAISSAGVPTLTFDTSTSPLSNPPLGGVIGNNGVYILRGPELDGSISSATIEYAGLYLPYAVDETTLVTIPNTDGGTDGVIQLNVTGGYEVQDYTQLGIQSGNLWQKGSVSSVSVIEAGSGFTRNQTATAPGRPVETVTTPSQKFIQVIAYVINGVNAALAVFERGERAIISINVNAPEYEFPFMRDETGNDIIAATTLSPYSDGDVEASTQYNHSTLVIRPETVASAATAKSTSDPTKWTATMDPINAYVTERLALRNTTQLDLQIRGDGRTLFQGQLTVLNKIA